MTAQYLRKASLIIGGQDGHGLDLSALRFAFSIRRGDIQTPNSADIRVYNVSDDTAQRILQRIPTPEFSRVVVQAGYDGNYGVIFDGTIKQVRRGRDSQTDTYLDITAADGDSAYNFSVTALSLSASETGPQDTIQHIVKGMAERGVTMGYLPDIPGNPLPRGKVVFGMTRDALRQQCKTLGFGWSIQDGKVNFIPLTSYMPGDIPELTSATGVVGLPEQTQDGIKLKVLLNPSLKIGQAVRLNNASIQQYRYNLSINQAGNNLLVSKNNKLNADGLYYVMLAEHSGDTRGNGWFTDLLCLAIDATVPATYVPRMGVSNQVGPIREFG